MPSPRVGHFPQTTIQWSSGDNFNGFCLIAFIPPLGGGGTYLETDLGLIDPSDKLPQFANCPIQNGLLNASLGLYFNADISPPNSTYTASFYDTTKRRIAGPGSPFTVTTDPFSLTIPTLVAPTTGGVAPSPDSGGDIVPGPIGPDMTEILQPFVITGAITGTTGSDGNPTFTLNVSPLFLLLLKNNLPQRPGLDYTLSGNVITFLAPQIPVLTPVTDTLYALGQA